MKVNKIFKIKMFQPLVMVMAILAATPLLGQQDALTYNLESYTPQLGLTARIKNQVLEIIWDGEHKNTLRIRFTVVNGVPTIQELAIKPHDGLWKVLTTNITPYYQIVSGKRRVTQQQTKPLEALGVRLTTKKLNEIKWNAFWDAPLYLEQKPPPTHQNAIPAKKSFANHPGMPRNPSEVGRTITKFKTNSCEVRTNGSRIEVLFSGADTGLFKGYLQYDIYRESHLIKQTLVAKTSEDGVAFKYNAGLSGFFYQNTPDVKWLNLEKSYESPQRINFSTTNPTIVKNSNRIIAANLQGGSVAFFPPPHRFFWARESEQNLGYGWYKKQTETRFALGIRQAETEEDPEFYHNFALYNARPNTWQHMPMFMYISPEQAPVAINKALQFTNNDTFKPLRGFKVLGSHYHVGLVKRLKALPKGAKLNDITAMKSVGINIYGVIDGARGPGRRDKGELYLNDLKEYYDAAKSQSDKNFLVMPNDENSTDGRPPFLGGHYDIMVPKPIYWRPERTENQPLVQAHPKYGKVYNLGTPTDMMQMAKRENILLSMPHPNAKGSTGYPYAIKDKEHFLHKNYFALGYRWGMGIDGAEKRLGDSRFLPLWNQTNNWLAAKGLPPKYALAISEARSDYGTRGKPITDDTYAMAPVNYLKIKKVPTVDNMESIINALSAGDYFVTTGEVLIPRFKIRGKGTRRTIIATVKWTFPLDFVEIVWGDGTATNRKIVSTTDLLPFGSKKFKFSIDVTGKKWIRFAAWDTASNGAMVQPVHINKILD